MTTRFCVLCASTLLLLGCSAKKDDTSTTASGSLEAAPCQPYQVPTGCEEALCKTYHCGAPDSFLDANRCQRKHCETQQDCAVDEECRMLRYVLPSCSGVTDAGVCFCGDDMMNVDNQLCLPKQ